MYNVATISSYIVSNDMRVGTELKPLPIAPSSWPVFSSSVPPCPHRVCQSGPLGAIIHDCYMSDNRTN